MPAGVLPSLHVAAKPPAGAPGRPQGFVNPEFNWAQFLSSSSTNRILEFLRTGDLSVACLADLSPYCRDRTFFASAVAALNERHVFEYNIWKWAVAHMDGPALQQLLPMTVLASRVSRWGVPLRGVYLLPLNRSDVGLQHLEFWPWVNPYCRPIPRGVCWLAVQLIAHSPACRCKVA